MQGYPRHPQDSYAHHHHPQHPNPHAPQHYQQPPPPHPGYGHGMPPQQPQQQQMSDEGPGTRKRKAQQAQQQAQQQQQQQLQMQQDDDEDEKPGSDAASASGGPGGATSAAGGAGSSKAKGGASEFVKKLYKMLDDGEYSDVVSWGHDGSTFVVKDMNQFTTAILPAHFKHSNFASFVRQLNKYDFHKVKNNDDGPSPYGENTWEFRHPNFRADMKDNLENIKRKAPAAKKAAQAAQQQRMRAAASNGPLDPSLAAGPSGSLAGSLPPGDYNALQVQLDGLARTQQAMQQHMTNLSQDYQAVIGEMMNFQRNMVAQDQLMQNLIQYLVSLEADQKGTASQDPSAPYVPSSQAQKLISSYTEVARASYDQMADLSRRASLSGGQFPNLPPLPPPPPNFGHFEFAPLGRRDDGAQRQNGGYEQQGGQGPRGPGGASASPGQQQPGQQGQPQQQPGQQPPSQQQPPPPQFVHPAFSSGDPQASTSAPAPTSTADRPPAAPRRQSNVPGWAVPPRVLLVEDDAVCRKLSSKFLEVFGCQIDVAVDGVSAVNKMNMQKYDLVLMDIVMPNLDGVSATSLIRQFDPMTPIISMTSNSGPNDIMTYFSHGMNDVLPKPFTKENLLSMLEKHLTHLKLMQQMAEIPRALGFTDNQIQDALAQSVVVTDEGGQQVLNPFSSMGISDQDYVEMLQGIAMEKEGKRGLEVVRDEGTARFQEVQ
ncbi:Transcription factor SKN7 [Rhodotorula toruloides]|uniref:BY PROTMAP: gi/472588030/gb/EMS25526.1/ two-component response regulator [Rhodosporidium toruloides NP11] gi/647401466/emb/CDR47729.1/ RHTO0S15e01134g1_1 [Rhodosporidium toruloides] n=1 Tax=Rhodotorula toruloides TaxID=5286 RepID=A0A0K3CH43_RHOTO|nr:Transcription factor SKN7 [Rhodotorula toruloides]PRQ74074.1 HSF-type DNA-binding-domain containing protein [Rhodotorula toruloides]